MILNKTLLAIASLALVSAFPISERATCSSYTLISTRATTEPQGSSAGFRTMISQTLAALPGGKEVSALSDDKVDPQEVTDRSFAILQYSDSLPPSFIAFQYDTVYPAVADQNSAAGTADVSP